jgi:hypothetical protein
VGVVLDYIDDPEDPNLLGHTECLIMSPDRRHQVLFLDVPEGNRDEPRTDARIAAVAGPPGSPTARPLGQGAAMARSCR